MKSEGTCEEECPSFTKKDYIMHTCESNANKIFAIDSWPMIMLILSLLAPASLTILSRYISKKLDCPWDVSTSLFSLIESINKFAFWIALWSSNSIFLFCTTGVSLGCSALLAIVFYESTFLPVQEALNDHRKNKGVDVSTKHQRNARQLVRILSYLSSIGTMRFLSSSFCGI